MQNNKGLSMSIQDPWLTEIIKGRKTVEGRAAAKGTFNSWIGKKVDMYNRDKNAMVKVTDVKHYDNLHDYLQAEWKKAAPQENTIESAEAAYRNIYYKNKDGVVEQVFGDDRIKNKKGMEAIYIELV